MKELLGLTDGSLLVGGLGDLRIGPAFEVAPHLSIPTGIGLENSQLAWIDGNGRTDAKMGKVRCRGGRKRVSFAACCRANSCIATSVVSAQRSGQPEFEICDQHDRLKLYECDSLNKFTQDAVSGIPAIEALLQTYSCRAHFADPKLNTL